MGRALATIATINAVEKHPDADLLEIVQVRGWKCVTRKADNFQVGQPVLYLEIDSHIDVSDERFAFLAKTGLRTSADGWRGHKLRTVKLRGVVSQGLVLPLDPFPELAGSIAGNDVTGLLPIRLWEPPIPFSGGDIIGGFPEGVPKTDEERVQNLTAEELRKALSWPNILITEKLDGSSGTGFVKESGLVGVAGRNWELSPESSMYTTVVESAAGRWLQDQPPGTYLQGELVGPSVQGNPLGLKRLQWFLFTGGHAAWDAVYRTDPYTIIDGSAVVDVVPRIPPGMILRDSTVDDLIAFADGTLSMLNPSVQAEGIVVRGYDDMMGLQSSFKVLNNSVLASEK